MKLRLVLLLMLVAIAVEAQVVRDTSNLTATADTSTPDTSALKLLEQLSVQPQIYQPLVPVDLAPIYIENLSRLLFWDRYRNGQFVIGVTNPRVKYEFEKYFQNRYLHGRKVKVVFINKDNVNDIKDLELIYVTNDQRMLLQLLYTTFTTHTIIVSENPNDLSFSDVVLRPAIDPNGKEYFQYSYNQFAINQKGIFIMPELSAYGE